MSNCDSLLNIFINQCSFQKLSVHNFVEFNQERESDERASLCTIAKKLIEQQRSNAASILEVLGTVQAYMIRCFCIRFCFNFRRGILLLRKYFTKFGLKGKMQFDFCT